MPNHPTLTAALWLFGVDALNQTLQTKYLMVTGHHFADFLIKEGKQAHYFQQTRRCEQADKQTVLSCDLQFATCQ